MPSNSTALSSLGCSIDKRLNRNATEMCRLIVVPPITCYRTIVLSTVTFLFCWSLLFYLQNFLLRYSCLVELSSLRSSQVSIGQASQILQRWKCTAVNSCCAPWRSQIPLTYYVLFIRESWEYIERFTFSPQLTPSSRLTAVKAFSWLLAWR